MSELIPPDDSAPRPQRIRRRVNWLRVSVYLLAIVVVLAIGFAGAWYVFRMEPKRVVDNALSQLPFYSSVGEVKWLDQHTLQIDDVRMGGFFYAERIVASASLEDLLRRRISDLQIIGGQVFTKPLFATMDKYSSQGGGEGLNWTISRLEIKRGLVMLDTQAIDTSIPINLGRRQPIILHNIRLNKPDSSEDMTREQTVEIQNVYLVSPFDPLAPVLAFPLSRVRFTYTEFWHHHIREIDLVRPTMFLGQDLFWFVDQFKKERKTLPETGVTAPWKVDRFEVQYGQLAINAFGQPVVRFPFFFQTKVDDIRLDQLDKISVKSSIPIQELTVEYPDYKIRIVKLTGQLYFSLPPSDATANNVVNTISIDELAWNDIPVTKVNSTITFDENGAYAKLNGACEGGQLSGNFEFYYTKGFTWNADFFADKINCQPIAQKLGGKYIDMTGTLDGKISVQGQTTDILNCQGLLTLGKPGVLVIKSLTDLLNRLPPGMSDLKKKMIGIAVKPFETYPYTNGQLKIDYKPGGGVGTLKLESPQNGQRQFDMYYHPYESSKVANDTDNR